MTSVCTCQGFDQMVIQLENHQERNNANQKTIEEERDGQTITPRLANLTQTRDPEDRRIRFSVIGRGDMVTLIALVVIVLDERMAFLGQALRYQVCDGKQQTDCQGVECVATRAFLFAGERITDCNISIHCEADGDPK